MITVNSIYLVQDEKQKVKPLGLYLVIHWVKPLIGGGVTNEQTM